MIRELFWGHLLVTLPPGNRLMLAALKDVLFQVTKPSLERTSMWCVEASHLVVGNGRYIKMFKLDILQAQLLAVEWADLVHVRDPRAACHAEGVQALGQLDAAA